MITVEQIKENSNYDVNEGIKYAKSFYATKAERPIKPKAPNSSATSDDYVAYAKSLKEYEIDYSKYQESYKEVMKNNAIVNGVIEEFIKDAAGLFDYVPEQYIDKVYAKAYEMGHSSGYYEVYIQLEDLVDIFM